MQKNKKKDQENFLSVRLNKILETRVDNDQEILEALKQLSTFYPANTLQTRRNLRSKIEKRSLDINYNFLNSFHNIKQSFENIYDDIHDMFTSIQDMTNRLQGIKIQTKQLLDQTKVLQRNSDTNNLKEKLTTTLLDNFVFKKEITLSQENQQDVNVINNIFVDLENIENIRTKCDLLITPGHKTLASSIIERMTSNQEDAIEKLYKWTLTNSRQVNNYHLMDSVARAMEKLQEHHTLFNSVINEYCTVRHSILVNEFINALTRGGSSGNPAPIELRAHDSQIYLTDMLVWIHKAVNTEKQYLLNLLKYCKKENVEVQLKQALSNITEGLCQPLSNRIEKILYSKIQVSNLYSIINLIRYYKKCITKVSSEGSLNSTLKNLENKSEQIFLSTLREAALAILQKVDSPTRDLSPTRAIIQSLALLRDLLSSASMSEGREIDMIKIAQSIIDPLMATVNEQASRLPPTDMAVYLLNCMYSMYTCLSLYEFMEDKLERLQAQSDAQIDTLISEQVGSLVANLNLGPIYTILQDSTNRPLSEIPGMEPQNLRKLLVKIENVTNPENVLLPQISLLSSSKHRNVIQKKAFDVLSAIYKELYTKVHDPVNSYNNPQNILDKTPEEFNNLLNKFTNK